MKWKTTKLLLLPALAIGVSLAMLAAPASAQNGSQTLKTNSKIAYHDGPVMWGSTDLYFIWYGCWPCGAGSDTEIQGILIDFASRLGSSSYALINTTYPDFIAAPNGALLYAGSVNDTSYSHGKELNALAIQGIVAKHIAAGNFPLDVSGIYIVVAGYDISSNATGFCTSPLTPPHHGIAPYNGVPMKYAFIGNPSLCLTTAASQYVSPDGIVLPSPNGNIVADAMASTLAHAINAVLTNPSGTAWFDRYGLENAAKCQGTFGETYTTENGARANMRLGARHFLIQQNWVNAPRKGYCGLSIQ